MGKYTFTWAHPANEVIVTGTFDNWLKTVKLEKENGVFQKTVELPRQKHMYKFVVDGKWVTNDSHPKEQDEQGIDNNVLRPFDIEEEEPVSTLSSAAPESSTAALAGAVPKASEESSADKPTPSSEDLPGAFPMTPAFETPAGEPQAFSVNPIPATEGPGNPVKLAPGEPVPDPSTLTNNTVQSTVKLDANEDGKQAAMVDGGEEQTAIKLDAKEDGKQAAMVNDGGQTVSVAPIPAMPGAGNPIKLAPGEPVPPPSTLTSNTISSTAKTDAASYEKSDALPPQLDPLILTPEAERAAKGGMFQLPPLSGSVIPESSLPKDTNTEVEKDTGVTIQSAAPDSTTAALAAQVPKEPRGVPAAVTESQKEADFPPEAAANPEAVMEKKEVEQELKEKVPEQPAAADNSAASQITGALATGATLAAGAVTAAAAAAYQNAPSAAQVTDTMRSGAGTAANAVSSTATAAKDSAPSTAQVSNSVGGATGTVTDAATSLKDRAAAAVGLKTQPAAASEVPEVVADSLKEAHASPEAAAHQEAVHEKKKVETELLQEVWKTEEPGTPAPKITADLAESGPGSQTLASEVPAVVAESVQEARASPEAAANKQAVEEKREVESELLKEAKQADEAGEPAPAITAATSETAPSPSTGAAAKNTQDAAKPTPEPFINVAETTSTTAAATAVPDVVAESQKEAHASPEAAANAEAVEDKKQVESELLKEVKTTDATGEPAPKVSSGSTTDASAAPAASQPSSAAADGLNASASQPAQSAATKAAADVASPESQPTGSAPDGLNASASKPAQSAATKAAAQAEPDSRDVSPMTKAPTAEQNQPTVTTGTDISKTETKTGWKDGAAPENAQGGPATPKKAAAPSTKDTPDSAASDKKKKRHSFFGKLKAKFKST
ncbi:carbohydrate-binding module family 48 protein [Sporormia fimetaria CBS 119925]|uniref:Carbohydrate-binding module family 48 protein n=1 Tax=Sporormia fimetaria CBS 119925 TaxID=1340428 RepID=A0A6A6VGI7_9PLEO|nr:carbohydrate-binding module family 48 protein [Sporormia fimetaria CBS 119925]